MVAVLLLFPSLAVFAEDDKPGTNKSEAPEGAAIHWAKGHDAHAAARTNRSPNLTWHGGNVMTNNNPARVEPIFWGSQWGGSFAGDKMAGLQTLYLGMSGSNYAKTSDEYKDATGYVTPTINYAQSHMDLSTANNGRFTSPILAEVCKVIQSPVSNGYYPVYVDIPRGSAGFCAWHSAGTCGSTPVQFAFFFNLDGDPGCDPQDTSGLHSQGLAALANVSGHELSETRTDPQLNGWYDSSGSENADKCAWSFGHPLLTFSDGSKWKVQGNWSNNAYNTQTGYPNTSGQKGCLDGN